MAFCTECGAKNPDELSFCTECGKSITSGGNAAQPTVFVPNVASMPSANTERPAENSANIVSTSVYFGFILLYSLPVIGWIICLIMAFAAKNVNLRNLARAVLIFIIIILMISAVFYFISGWFTGVFMEQLSGLLPAEMRGLTLNEVFEMFKNAKPVQNN